MAENNFISPIHSLYTEPLFQFGHFCGTLAFMWICDYKTSFPGEPRSEREPVYPYNCANFGHLHQCYRSGCQGLKSGILFYFFLLEKTNNRLVQLSTFSYVPTLSVALGFGLFIEFVDKKKIANITSCFL